MLMARVSGQNVESLMTHSSSFSLQFGAGVVCLLAIVSIAMAQDTTGSAKPETGVVLTKLSAPVYPPLARGARISGDVKVELTIRRDGSVESAVLFSGHPILAEAALKSARESAFECRGCTAEGTTYSLTFAFEIDGECHFGPTCERVESPPRVQQSQDRVAVIVEPWCTCDPAVTITRLKWRSAKCLYLWHCSSRVIDAH